MKEVSKMTDQQLNRALAELMGYLIFIGKGDAPIYKLITPDGRIFGTARGSVERAWDLNSPQYCTDPASSLEVQAAAIAKDKSKYFAALLEIRGILLTADKVTCCEAVALATPRQRAEAAYMTLKGV